MSGFGDGTPSLFLQRRERRPRESTLKRITPLPSAHAKKIHAGEGEALLFYLQSCQATPLPIQSDTQTSSVAFGEVCRLATRRSGAQSVVQAARVHRQV